MKTTKKPTKKPKKPRDYIDRLQPAWRPCYRCKKMVNSFGFMLWNPKRFICAKCHNLNPYNKRNKRKRANQ